jgi:hypothetical protein
MSKQDKRDYYLRKTYGISLEEFNRMFEAQDGCCKICGYSDADDPLVVDHCHRSGDVRGLLCGRCNRGIGSFFDDPNILQNAIDYIEEHTGVKRKTALK